MISDGSCMNKMCLVKERWRQKERAWGGKEVRECDRERWKEILANYSEINAERSISAGYLRNVCVYACVVPGCSIIWHNSVEVTRLHIFYLFTAADDWQSHNMTNWSKLLQSLSSFQDLTRIHTRCKTSVMFRLTLVLSEKTQPARSFISMRTLFWCKQTSWCRGLLMSASIHSW